MRRFKHAGILNDVGTMELPPRPARTVNVHRSQYDTMRFMYGWQGVAGAQIWVARILMPWAADPAPYRKLEYVTKNRAAYVPAATPQRMPAPHRNVQVSHAADHESPVRSSGRVLPEYAMAHRLVWQMPEHYRNPVRFRYKGGPGDISAMPRQAPPSVVHTKIHLDLPSFYDI